MAVNADGLYAQILKCCKILNRGYTSARNSGIVWLNNFCAEFLQFSTDLHTFFQTQTEIANSIEAHDDIYIIYLCLKQIVTCIKHMERTIKAEEISRMAQTASRHHFLDRILFCLRKLRKSLREIVANKYKEPIMVEAPFGELLDLLLDHISPYSSYEVDADEQVAYEFLDAVEQSDKIRSMVDVVIGHTVAFANVALAQDKRALSALCQKLLRECIAFQEECINTQCTHITSNRRLRAISTENALYQLEDYLNESLLRLIYTCFLDHSKLSIEKLRAFRRTYKEDCQEWDEMVADFDINTDRTTRIGIFGMFFSRTIKMKSAVATCLASLEVTDSCIIPSLDSKFSADLYSEILEQHFNEEIAAFRQLIQEIINSQSFASCYYDMLTQCIARAEKNYNKLELQDLSQQGEILYEHFKLRVNYKQLRKKPERKALYEEFKLILRECQAILACADQVEPQRVLKRFKILRSILRKFVDSLKVKELPSYRQKQDNSQQPPELCVSDEPNDPEFLFESEGIWPSINSILYNDNEENRRRCKTSNIESLMIHCSLMSSVHRSWLLAQPPSPVSKCRVAARQRRRILTVEMPPVPAPAHAPVPAPVPASEPEQAATAGDAENGPNRRGACGVIKERRYSLRRKESLRTAMFKRKKLSESAKANKNYNKNSFGLKISEMLDQLTSLTNQFRCDLEPDNLDSTQK